MFLVRTLVSGMNMLDLEHSQVEKVEETVGGKGMRVTQRR